MSLSNLTRLAIAAGLGGVLSFSLPAVAQPAADLPYCSASVTDHCMQRSDAGWHGGRSEARHGTHHGRHHRQHGHGHARHNRHGHHGGTGRH